MNKMGGGEFVIFYLILEISKTRTSRFAVTTGKEFCNKNNKEITIIYSDELISFRANIFVRGL